MARKRKLEPEVLPDTDAWMVTFSDLISLMLTFFVLIISMSTLDQTKLEDISRNFTQTLLLFHAGEGTEPFVPPPLKQRIDPNITPQNMMLAMRQRSMSVFKHSTLSHKVKTLVLKDRLILRINNTTLFDPGRATFRSEHVKVMKQLAHMLAASPGNIRIEGYADRSELSQTGRPESQAEVFPDVWSLSLARAASVLHVLVAEGVNPSRLSLVGYGSGGGGQGSAVRGQVTGDRGREVPRRRERTEINTRHSAPEFKGRGPEAGSVKAKTSPSPEADRHVDIVLFKPGSQ